MIRVFLADDHDVVREGLRRLLQDEVDVEIVGEASNASELLSRLADAAPDILVLDVSMPGPGIDDLLHQLQMLWPRGRTIVLSMHAEEEYAARVIKAGAAAYLTKGESAQHLVPAIRRAYGGGSYVTKSVGQLLADELAHPQPQDPLVLLSERERQVLKLLGAGHSSKRIAASLGISPKTISTYRARLLEKLQADSTAELIRFAIMHKLVD